MSFSSDATPNVTGEASYSSRNNYPSKTKRLGHPNVSNYAKRLRHTSNVTASKFKGVVCQLNGHWGAQIYVNYKIIWLGTFKSEKEAAMAYDSAAIKLRNWDSFRNFPWTDITAQEPNFQHQFSTEAVLNMIKDGSYASEFSDYLNVKLQTQEIEVDRDLGTTPEGKVYSRRQLFQKVLTRSDVSMLYRLVIPKTNAVKYFPRTSEGETGNGEEVELVFHDKLMRLWKFRYCYLKSSQSFVFTRGWNKFVKEKELKVKDTITFYRCQCSNGVVDNDVSSFSLIDVNYYDKLEDPKASGGFMENVGSVAEFIKASKDANNEEFKKRPQLLEPGRGSDVTEEDDQLDGAVGVESVRSEEKGFRLFGVQII